ncbi:unnamed protein product [Calypogeia fissa]
MANSTSSDGSERSGNSRAVHLLSRRVCGLVEATQRDATGNWDSRQEIGKESFTMLLCKSGGCVPRFCLHKASVGQVLH